MRVRSWLAGLVALLLGCAVRAHDPGISTAQGELRAGVLILTTGFAPADAELLLPAGTPRAERWGPAEFDAVRDQLQALAPRLWEMESAGSAVSPRESTVELLPGDNVSFRLVYPRGNDAGGFTLRAPRLPDLPAGHRQFVIISDEHGLVVAKKLISARDFAIDVPPAAGPADAGTSAAVPAPAPAAASDATTFWGFLRLGVEHIWTGYDHLLFLFGLLIVCRSFRSIVAIVSCFTLAHSLTLALATLDVVNLPARWVEPAIAASIVYVGVENLLRRGAEPRGRWLLTFFFGLIHGFGFASVLRDLGVGGGVQGIALPLFTFNLGVEVGQIAMAAAVLPLVWRLRRNEARASRIVTGLSAIVALAGLYWLLQRTVFT